MKALVVYSSRTGNTRKIAEAIAAVLPGCEIHPVESAPAPEGYDLVAVGYWVDKGMPDAQAKAYLETVRDAKWLCSARWAHGRIPITPETASRRAKRW